MPENVPELVTSQLSDWLTLIAREEIFDGLHC
jgi:hypothetical protein